MCVCAPSMESRGKGARARAQGLGRKTTSAHVQVLVRDQTLHIHIFCPRVAIKIAKVHPGRVRAILPLQASGRVSRLPSCSCVSTPTWRARPRTSRQRGLYCWRPHPYSLPDAGRPGHRRRPSAPERVAPEGVSVVDRDDTRPGRVLMVTGSGGGPGTPLPPVDMVSNC